jgi:hypothetical protein
VNGSFIGQAALVTADSGQRWTGYATLPSTFQVTALSCPSTTVCWASGMDWNSGPAVAESTDGGQTWTDMTPAAWSTVTWWVNPNGTYQLNGISCLSSQVCVAVGGLNYSDGMGTTISTRDGGATWSRYTDHAPSRIQQFFSVSCLPGPDGELPVCRAAAVGTTGPVAVVSRNGGVSWHAAASVDTTGWLNSISCPDRGYQRRRALGTQDGGGLAA